MRYNTKHRFNSTVLSVVLTILFYVGTYAVREYDPLGFIPQLMQVGLSLLGFISIINLVIDIGIMLGHDVADV